MRLNLSILSRSLLPRRFVRFQIGFSFVRVPVAHVALIQEELARMVEESVCAAADSEALGLDARRVDVQSAGAMNVLAGAVQRVLRAHPEYERDRECWGLTHLRAACEVVASGATRTVIRKQLATDRRGFMQWAYEADPPTRGKVFRFAVGLIAVDTFLIWALQKEIHSTQDKGATKTFVIVLIAIVLILCTWPLFTGFMARTQMAEPWVPLFRFLDSIRLSLSVGAGLAAYSYIENTPGPSGSTEYFRSVGELIGLLAITLAVEARLSAPAREDVPFRGVLVLAGFALVAYGEYTCLHVLAGSAPTRSDFAVVDGVLVGMGVSIALLAALGPMPFRRSPDGRPLREPPPTEPKNPASSDGHPPA